MATATTKARTARPKQPQPPTVIRRIGADLYRVSSASHPGTGHQTSPHTCTCPAGKFGRSCRHKALVRAYHAWRLEQMDRAARQTMHASGMAALQEAFA